MITGGYLEAFVAACACRGCVVSELAEVKRSQTGGIGVFVDVDRLVAQADRASDEDLVLLRVPHSETLSLDSIMAGLLHEQLEHDAQCRDGWLNQSEIMKRLLSELNLGFSQDPDAQARTGLNEANILISEISLLVCLKEIRKQIEAEADVDGEYSQFLRTCPFARHDYYLDLLLNTDIDCLKLDDNYHTVYLAYFQHYERVYKNRIDSIKRRALLQALTEQPASLDLQFITEQFLEHVQMTIVSRILEVPSAVDDQDEAYGYQVASTMVPLIDFVNHSIGSVNAAFDTDPATNDVVLKLKSEFINECVHSSQEERPHEAEVFIQYSEYDDVLKYITTYGFIPKSASEHGSIYEVCVDRGFADSYKVSGCGYEHQLGVLLKHLGLPPNFQFIVKYNNDGVIDDLKLNLLENYLVFGFKSGLTYYPEKAKSMIGEQFGEEDAEKVLEELNKYDVIPPGEGEQIPFKLLDSEDFTSAQELLAITEDEEVDEMLRELVVFIYKYCEFRIDQLKRAGIHGTNAKNTNSLVLAVVSTEIEILEALIKKYKELLANNEDPSEALIEYEEHAFSEDWKVNKLKPRMIPFDQLMKISRKFRTENSDGVEEVAELIDKNL